MDKNKTHISTPQENSPDRTVRLTDSQISEAGKSSRHLDTEKHVKFLDNDISDLKDTLHAGASAISNIFSFAKETFLPDFQDNEQAEDRDDTTKTGHITQIQYSENVTAQNDVQREKLPHLENCYEIIKEFANGGQGILYTARDLALNRIVALKSLRPELLDKQQVYDAFVSEAKITAQLEHPAIVSIYNILQDSKNGIHLAMKMVHGKDLRTYLNEVALQFTRGEATMKLYKTRLRRRLSMFLKVCDALAYAHSRSIIHCDLKPENIMMGEYGEVYVMDWGIARVIRDKGGNLLEQNNSKPLDGTPRFIPPEAFSGKTRDERADIYALGMILFEILTLQHAYDENNIKEVIRAVKSNQRKPVRHKFGYPISSDLVAIVNKATAHNPDDRYQSVPELTMDIQHYLAGEAVAAAPEGVIGHAFRWVSLHSRSMILLCIAGWLIAALIAGKEAKRQLSRLSEQSEIQARKLHQANFKHREQEALRHVSEMDGAVIQNAMMIYNRLAVITSNLKNLSNLASTMLENTYINETSEILEAYPYTDFRKSDSSASQGAFFKIFNRTVNPHCVSYLFPEADNGYTLDEKSTEILGKLSPLFALLRNLILLSDGDTVTARNMNTLLSKMIDNGMLLRRVYVSLDKPPLHISYPGHGEYPDGYDPRKRPWYYECANSVCQNKDYSEYWSAPYHDIDEGNWVITCSMPIIGKKDETFLGLVSFDLSLDKFKELVLSNGNTAKDSIDAKYLVTKSGETLASFSLNEENQESSIAISERAMEQLQEAMTSNDYGHCTLREGGRSIQYHFAYIPVLKLYIIERSTLSIPRERWHLFN